MNKKHWISVYPGEEISEALLRDLINDSWNLVVDGLAKRDQKRVRPAKAEIYSAFFSLTISR